MVVVAALSAPPMVSGDGGDRELLFSQGIAAYDGREYSRSTEIFADLTRRDRGDCEAAYYQGLSLMAEGREAEAEAVLRDLWARHPGFFDAGRELCACLVRSGKRSEAGLVLAQLRRAAATEEERESLIPLDGLLAGGERPGPKRWGGRISARYEYDDNVALVPDNEALVGVTHKGDWRFLTTCELDVAPVVADRFELDTGYYFVQSVHNEMKKFNLQGHVVDATVRYRGCEAVTPFVGYEYAYYFLDDCTQSYLRANRIRGGVEVPAASHAFYRFFWENGFDDYMLPISSEADNWDTEPSTTVGLEQYLFLGRGRNAFWHTIVAYDNNNAQGKNYYYNGIDLVGELFIPLADRLSADVSLEYCAQDYSRNVDGRKDHRINLNAGIRRSIGWDVDIVFNYNHITNLSNVGLYQFDRNIYSMILEMGF